MEKFSINIDKKDYVVSDQFITGKQIKILAGITERDEALAKATYVAEIGNLGWSAYKIINKPMPDEQILDNDCIDLLEEKDSKFFTVCVGTRIIKFIKQL